MVAAGGGGAADDDDDDGMLAKSVEKLRLQQLQLQMNDRRRGQIEWLQKTSEDLPLTFRRGLVLHRGFHSMDDTGDRPVENSLTAYETAWR